MAARNPLKLLAALALTSQTALAVPLPKCPSGNLGTESQANLLHKIAILGDNGRRTFKEFSEDTSIPLNKVQKDFSGVGTFWCAGSPSTAQLTGSNDVITTAAHAFYLKDCRPVVSDGNPCQFQPKDSSEMYDVYLDWNNLENSPDPRNARIKCPRDHSDWAVLKLKRPVSGASHFAIPEADMTPESVSEIIQVSAKATYYRRSSDYFIQKCSTHGFDPRYALDNKRVLLHDCDTEPGASGGAQVQFSPRDNKYYLVGIHKGGSSEAESSQGRAVRMKEYDGKDAANNSVLLRGAFLSEIKRLRDLKIRSANLD